MKKMKEKIFIAIFLIIILMANMSFASYSTVTMSVVEEPVCTIPIGDNSSFEKKLISKDLNNKEVTLQLQVNNNEALVVPTGEIVVVIDNSASMQNDVTTSSTRKDLVFNSANKLITDLLKDNDKLKISVVSFSTNSDASKEGTISDASVVSTLTNNASTLTKAISNIEANGARTDLQAGLLLGSQQFSTENNNKYMVVLTDGVPNVAIDYDKTYYSDDVIAKTKAQLQSISSSKINLITLLTGIDDENYVPAGVTKTFGKIISEIFGTVTAPTAGTFYYVTDDKVENTITNTIYNSLLPVKKPFKNITVTDYFPKEIINNFDFAYVSNANIGTISTKVDTSTNSITWTIPELKSGETATVQYKLKLKENFDSTIVDKILNTNEKVDINYTDSNGSTQAKTSDISPKLKLTEPPAVLPKAGSTTLIVLGILIGGLLVFSLSKVVIINYKMKN